MEGRQTVPVVLFNEVHCCFCVTEDEAWESKGLNASKIGGAENLTMVVKAGVGESTLPDVVA